MRGVAGLLVFFRDLPSFEADQGDEDGAENLDKSRYSSHSP